MSGLLGPFGVGPRQPTAMIGNISKNGPVFASIRHFFGPM